MNNVNSIAGSIVDLERKKIVSEIINIHKINLIPMHYVRRENEIGSGAQAKVFKAIYNTGNGDKYVTLKLFKDIDWLTLGNELVILSNLSHPNIPNFLGIVYDDDYIGLIFDYIDGVPLSDLNFVNFNDEIKLKIVKTLCSVVEYIHSKKYIHRDIKPSNIIIDENYNLYLIDFGISKVCSSDSGYTFTRIKGTIAYSAPEMIIEVAENEYNEKYCGISIKTDVWSVGVLISYLYSGCYPWSNEYNCSDPSITNLLIRGTPFPIPENISNQSIRKIVELCTKTNTDERAYIQDINSMLSCI